MKTASGTNEQPQQFKGGVFRSGGFPLPPMPRFIRGEALDEVKAGARTPKC